MSYLSMLWKHSGFLWLEMRQMAEFKADFYLFWLESFIKAAVMCLFWWKMWSFEAVEGGFSAIDRHVFMTLMVGTQVFQLPYRGSERISQLLEEPVVTGRMALVLCRPVHPLWMNLFRVICQQGRLLILAVLIWWGFSVSLFPLLGLESSFDWGRWPMVSCSLLLGLLLNFFLYSFLGSLSFWVGYVWSLLYVVTLFSAFFSGQYFPLHVNADLEFWSRFLPFRYIAYSPILVGTGMGGWQELMFQSLATLVLGSLAFWVYRCGVSKFEASGG